MPIDEFCDLGALLAELFLLFGLTTFAVCP